MNSFASNLRMEDEFTARLVDALRPLYSARGLRLMRFARADGMAKQAMDVAMQRKSGDLAMVRDSDGKYEALIDLKVERQARPNVYYETESNGTLNPERYTPGWGRTLMVDRIWYAFIDIGAVAILDLHRLRSWLDERVRVGNRTVLRYMTFTEMLQEQHQQRNVTIGRLVPFRLIPAPIWLGAIVLTGKAAKGASREHFLDMLPHDRFSNLPQAA